MGGRCKEGCLEGEGGDDQEGSRTENRACAGRIYTNEVFNTNRVNREGA